MGRFIFWRLIQAIPVIFAVITVTFFLVRSAPGGPFDSEKAVLPEVKRALEAQYKLDLPLHEQYFAYLGDLANGDLGPSFKYPGRSVNEILGSGLPVTAELGFYALCFALMIGVFAGVFAALKPNTKQDYIPMGMAMIGICMPSFLLGPSVGAGVWYSIGMATDCGLGDLPGDKILPSITLGLGLCGLYRATESCRHARNPLAGLHPNRKSQGVARMASGDAARLARWTDTGHRLLRPRIRGFIGGVICRRDHLPDPGPWTVLCPSGL